MKNQIKNIEIKVGLLTSLTLILYFLFMKLVDLIQIVELRALNIFILLGGVYVAFYYERKQTHSNIEYFRGLLLGILTALYAIIPFSLFVFFYLREIDPYLIRVLQSHTILIGVKITLEIVAESILIEGIVSGVLITFILMQYYRAGFNDPVKKQESFEG